MAGVNSLVLIPLVIAIMLFTARFYGRERAYSKTSASFLLAVTSVAILLSYPLVLVFGHMFAYGTLVYAAASGVLLLLSLLLLFVI